MVVQEVMRSDRPFSGMLSSSSVTIDFDLEPVLTQYYPQICTRIICLVARPLNFIIDCSAANSQFMMSILSALGSEGRKSNESLTYSETEAIQ